MTKLDSLTRSAVHHTLHCLLGCSIGEILGMILTTALGWSNVANIIVSIGLAFLFGYLLTAWSLLRNGYTARKAIHTAVVTDTTSIVSMEAVDNIFILLVPGAISANLDTELFWISLGVSLIVAFVFTVPVNRFFIARNSHGHHH